MKKKNLVFVLFCIFFINNNVIFSQISKYSNDFLNIGTGARYLSLGNCAVSQSQDANSSLWNPATLNDINKKIDLSVMHAEYFVGIAKFDFLGVAYRIADSSVLAVSLIRLGIDDIQNTLELFDQNGNIDYSRIELFSVSDNALIFSFARKSKIKGLALGANAKIIYRHQGKFANCYGFGIDIGARYHFKKWKFGILAKDVTTTFNAWVINQEHFTESFVLSGNDIPENSLEITMPQIIIGASRNWKIAKKLEMEIVADINCYFDGKRNVLLNTKIASIDPHMAMEWKYNKIIFIRAGVNNVQHFKHFDYNYISVQPNLGLGMVIKKFSLDYALTNIANISGGLYSNIFSLNYSF